MTKSKFLIFTGVIFVAQTFLHLGCRQEKETLPVYHEILGKEESCVQCHGPVEGLVESHNPQIIGCTPCHLGDPTSELAAEAHKDMIIIPGNLNQVHLTCGAANCHQDMTERVKKSLMNTMAGVVAVDKYVFGETDTLSGLYDIHHLDLKTPADYHLRQLCASCHLGREKLESGPITERSRGGGCLACHLQYQENALVSHHEYKDNPATVLPEFHHPRLSSSVSDENCFGCHSRSARISTSYTGWHETRLDELPENHANFRLLEDGRVFEKIKEDVHYMAGMSCIDCHDASETMGDGQTYFHQEEAVKIQCKDCHMLEEELYTYDELDTESKKLMALRNWEETGKSFKSKNNGNSPLYNVFQEKDIIYVRGKNNDTTYKAPLIDPQCLRGQAHDNVSCQSCHSEWAPQCIGCHNTFESDELVYDWLTRERRKGRWVEHLGSFFADSPTLGIVEKKLNGQEIRQIKTFISGMILSIDKSGFPHSEKESSSFDRLFAPLDPHTTSSTSRTCESCHLDPNALGYGRGKLVLENNVFEFQSDYADSEDGLPQDAWIPFLKPYSGQKSTRPNARPFTIEEQKTLLNPGACLMCHDGSSKVMQSTLFDFDSSVRGMSDECILPYPQ